jgi:hypothetical protein
MWHIAMPVEEPSTASTTDSGLKFHAAAHQECSEIKADFPSSNA